MDLLTISDNYGARKSRVRIGRGIGSGCGKTGGRGGKGQTARSGVAIKNFEGGQMPIHMRMPKRGFTNIMRKDYVVVNTGRLQQAVDAGVLDITKPVNAEVLVACGVLRRSRDGLRLLNKGDLAAKIQIAVHGASAAAIATVEKAGGTVQLLTQQSAA